MKAFRTGTGRPIRLTSVLGKGGEGTVFHVDGEKDIAAKVYTDGKHLERRDKISTMVATELHRRSTLIAFPIETLMGERGEFVGFTMRKVGGVQPIHELYAPGSRKHEFPTADFRFLARTATNVARAIASVHQTGCVIGDINHSGFLVSQQATVTLIDADSFQVKSGSRVYRCRVGTGEYTPPELQGLALDQIDREPSHDSFGLAVLVFQLLFMGRHPFAGKFGGVGDMPIEKAIKEGRFTYSIRRRTTTRMDPPPFVATLSDVTPDLALGFELAFPADGSAFRSRPTAAEWVKVLERFESELIPCRAKPVHHHYRNAPGCPWCRLESGMGVELFRPAGSQTSARPSNFDLTTAIATIEAIRSPGPTPNPFGIVPPANNLAKSGYAKEIRRQAFIQNAVGIFVAALSLVLLVVVPPLAVVGAIFAAILLLTGGARTQLRQALRQAQSNWDAAVKEWEVEANENRFEQKKAELAVLVSGYKALSGLEKSRLDDLDRRRREFQLQRYLEGHSLARARISGIGDTKKSTLASYGIEDAHDISYNRVTNVPGFGPATAKKLVDWRVSVERRFVFNPNQGPDPAAIQKVRDDIAGQRAAIEQSLRAGPIQLEQLRQHSMSARARPTEKLIEAHRALRQAQIDAA